MSNNDKKNKISLNNTQASLLAASLCVGGLTGVCALLESSTQESISESVEPLSITKVASESTNAVAAGPEPVAESLIITATGGGITTTAGTAEEPIFRFPNGKEVWKDSSGNMYTKDNKNYARVEKAAERIYDSFNGNHEIKCTESGLLLPNMELAEKLNEILKSNNKDTLYQALTAIQEVLEEKDKEENITLKLKEK